MNESIDKLLDFIVTSWNEIEKANYACSIEVIANQDIISRLYYILKACKMKKLKVGK